MKIKFERSLPHMDDSKKRKIQPDKIKESGWTVDDYMELPEDGNQYEIVSGILELRPSPSTSHQRLSHTIDHLITDQCKNEYIIICAPIDVFFADNETRQPDIVMIHRSREEIVEERGIVGAPDLVVEIISPNSAKRDRLQKKEIYERSGVPEYWIVDPFNKTIEQYTLRKGSSVYQLENLYDQHDTVRSARIPCLTFSVEDAMKLS
jgi:Uma2 family endonuclease